RCHTPSEISSSARPANTISPGSTPRSCRWCRASTASTPSSAQAGVADHARVRFRHREGAIPIRSANTRPKCELSLKPHAKAISVMERSAVSGADNSHRSLQQIILGPPPFLGGADHPILPIAPRRPGFRCFLLEGRMVDPKLFSLLTDDIYGAILDESRWLDALHQTAQFVGAQAGVLLWRNEFGGASDPVCWSVGIEPRYAESYAERYAKLDPLRAAMLSREIGEVASATELLPRSEFMESRFYKEWAQPQ